MRGGGQMEEHATEGVGAQVLWAIDAGGSQGESRRPLQEQEKGTLIPEAVAARGCKQPGARGVDVHRVQLHGLRGRAVCGGKQCGGEKCGWTARASGAGVSSVGEQCRGKQRG